MATSAFHRPLRLAVTGGAGCIGSHFSAVTHAAGHEVHVLDDLRSGSADGLVTGVRLHRVSLQDTSRVVRVLNVAQPDAVIHFAGSISVGESVAKPVDYYENNVAATLSLLCAMPATNVRNLVFSSSAAVYGMPDTSGPIAESHIKSPINPYGRSKWMVEQILEDTARAGDLSCCALRYFNAAGASPDGLNGERHNPETHLIPLAIHAALRGTPLTIFGSDYPTRDGTCVRDYVHVNDLAVAHLSSVNHLLHGGESLSANLGTGRFVSALQIVEAVQVATQRPVHVTLAERREGDPAELVADSTLAGRVLRWQPRSSALPVLAADAARWEARRVQQLGRA